MTVNIEQTSTHRQERMPEKRGKICSRVVAGLVCWRFPACYEKTKYPSGLTQINEKKQIFLQYFFGVLFKEVDLKTSIIKLKTLTAAHFPERLETLTHELLMKQLALDLISKQIQSDMTHCMRLARN